ncbi:HPr kinase/phosphorylase [Ahrensia sp. 13_GOM-1096m]|uniref:HPr kinase/phosphorylase n=1 Tax=Ahrensia sp. 13_GOM-1096m TaxID=1380380 RepID=UPI00068569C8|nr:HPr kinase/phosphatase C-terminal domain-containing protein [Ahrensia sp. 13_GOM-1096m]
MTASPKNIHANLIDIDAKGVLIKGEAGSGKTTLMLHLYRRCLSAGVPVHIISDDQTLLEEQNGQLMGRVPPTLAGKIEIRGLGIVNREQTLSHSKIELCVTLDREEIMLRYWDSQFEKIGNFEVKKLCLSSANNEAAGNAVLAALNLPLSV